MISQGVSDARQDARIGTFSDRNVAVLDDSYGIVMSHPSTSRAERPRPRNERLRADGARSSRRLDEEPFRTEM